MDKKEITDEEFKKWWANCLLNAENHSPDKVTVGSPIEIIKRHPLYIGNSAFSLSHLFCRLDKIRQRQSL